MSTQVPFDRVLEQKSILVMTAQILVNEIKNKNVTLSQIGLLIVDECHDCQVSSWCKLRVRHSASVAKELKATLWRHLFEFRNMCMSLNSP